MFPLPDNTGRLVDLNISTIASCAFFYPGSVSGNCRLSLQFENRWNDRRELFPYKLFSMLSGQDLEYRDFKFQILNLHNHPTATVSFVQPVSQYDTSSYSVAR